MSVMTIKPTPEQVAAEITRLKALRPRVPAQGFFGYDNHASIDAQIQVLEDGMSLNTVVTRYGEGSQEFSDYVFACAFLAHDWLAGELAVDEGSPASGWEDIAQ